MRFVNWSRPLKAAGQVEDVESPAKAFSLTIIVYVEVYSRLSRRNVTFKHAFPESHYSCVA